VTGDTKADRRLHPSTLFFRFIRRAPEFVLGLPALIGFASDAGMRRILLIALLGAVISFAASLAGWLRFRYGVGADEIVIESGVFQRQRRIVPFDRVQDIDIEQPLLARLFGTAKVKIETGGAGKDEGSLDAISLSEAHRLRDVIRRGAPAFAHPPNHVALDPAEEPILFQMHLPRLLLAGLFNFSLVFLAIIGGALQSLQPLIERRLGDPEKWIMPTPELAAAAGLYLTLALLGIVIFLGVVTGVFRTVARDYGFRLSRTHTGLRRGRGLFTLSEVIIPLRRIQLALISSGWLRRRLGWFALELQTLSADAQQSGHQAAAPFARMGEITPILAEAGLAELPSDDAYIHVSRRSIARRCLGHLLPLGLGAAAFALVWPLALLIVVPVAITAAAVVLQWRRHLYALTPSALYVAEGLLQPRLWIVPYENSQSISLTRSPLQRRLGLASLTVDTAGASIFRYPVIRDLEAPEAEALAAHLLDRYRATRRAGRQPSRKQPNPAPLHQLR
jgi:putative membrane protein